MIIVGWLQLWVSKQYDDGGAVITRCGQESEVTPLHTVVCGSHLITPSPASGVAQLCLPANISPRKHQQNIIHTSVTRKK